MTGWECADCGKDTNDEYYMVLDEIWSQYGAGEGLLCIGCLETRMGRSLDKWDFNDYPINDTSWGGKSPRLIDRLS